MTNKTASSQLENLLLVTTLLLIFIIAARAPLDNDLWWHLRSGEVTWQTLQPTLTDHFSYTRFGQPWINHSWLSQVIIYGLFRVGGVPALAAFTALGAAVMMGLVFFQCVGNALIKSSAVLLGGMVASMVWSPRPQMFSLVLFALIGLLLDRYKRQRPVSLWIFPLIFAVWSNLHGGYPLGIMLAGVFLIGETIENILCPSAKDTLTRRQLANLAFWMVVSIVVLLFNPNGFDTWFIPFKTVNVAALRNLVSEWSSPNFHDPVQQLMLLLWFALFAGAMYAKQRLGWTGLLTILLFGGMAFVSRRNFGPFAIAVSPILSRLLWNDLQEFQHYLSQNKNGELFQKFIPHIRSGKSLPLRWQRTINLTFIGFLAFACCLKVFVVTYPPFYQNYLKQLYPVAAVNWLKSSDLPGNLLNEYDWGGYLIWNLRDRHVFLDGRTDLFGDEIINTWIDIVQAEDEMQEYLDKWEINMVLLSTDRPAARFLPLMGWKAVYKDQTAVILARAPN